MKFKTIVADLDLLINFITSFKSDKIIKLVRVTLTNQKISFSSYCGNSNLKIFAGVKLGMVFKKTTLESQTGEIVFDVNLGNLLQSLKSFKDGGYDDEIMIKLSRRNNESVLSIHGNKKGVNSSSIEQYVPVEMSKKLNDNSYIEPSIPDPPVYLVLPSTKDLESIVKTMTNVSKEVQLDANMAGEMSFSVKNELYQITSKFENLGIPSIEGRSPPTKDINVKQSTVIDIQHLRIFLKCKYFMPTSLICCMIENFNVVLHALRDEMEAYITYYLPVKENEDKKNI